MYLICGLFSPQFLYFWSDMNLFNNNKIKEKFISQAIFCMDIRSPVVKLLSSSWSNLLWAPFQCWRLGGSSSAVWWYLECPILSLWMLQLEEFQGLTPFFILLYHFLSSYNIAEILHVFTVKVPYLLSHLITH